MTFTIYGPSYSTYARSVRLTLEEKGAAYELVPVDILSGQHQAPEHRTRNPFAVVPAFSHDGFELYETGAIVRYLDEVAPGPTLTPADAKARARMSQAMCILDAYAYASIIGKIVWQRAIVPMTGGTPDDAVVAAALPRAQLCLAEWERLMAAGPWLAGPSISLADLMVAPVMAYLTMTPEGGTLLAERPALARWWETMRQRPSMAATQPAFG